MRSGKAIVAIAAWVLAFWLLLPRAENWPDWAEALAFGALMLGPVIIIAVLLVRHQIDLDRHPISAPAGRS